MKKFLVCISIFLISSQLLFAQAWFNKDFTIRIVKENNENFCSFNGLKWEKIQCKDSAGVSYFNNKSKSFTLTKSNDSWNYVQKDGKKIDTLAIHPREDIDTSKNIPYWKGACFAGNFMRADGNEILTIDFRTIQYKTKSGTWKQLRMPKYDMKLFNISGLDYDNKTITLQFRFPSCKLDNFERYSGTFPPEDFDEAKEKPEEPNEPQYNGGYEEKPVTYFYSEKEIDVLFDVKTTFVKTEPNPGPMGWDLKLKNNKTYHKGVEIPNVFWEGKIPQVHLNTSEGYIVESEKLNIFFNENMSNMGFSKSEIDECVEYWQPRFKKKFVEVYVAYVQETNGSQTYNSNGFHYYMDFPETITPQPNHIFRLCYYFRESDIKKEMPSPTLPTMKRKGFYIVEWGGMDITHLPTSVLTIK